MKAILSTDCEQRLAASRERARAARGEYFSLVLFIMLCKVILSFESVDETLKCDHSLETIEQYFPVVLFIMLYKVVLTLSLRIKS